MGEAATPDSLSGDGHTAKTTGTGDHGHKQAQ